MALKAEAMIGHLEDCAVHDNARHALAKPYLIGGQGMDAERFFTCEVAELV